MIWEVSIYSLQQQVHTFWGESREVCVFLWGGGAPLHACDLNRIPLWGLSAPIPLLFSLLVLCLPRLLYSLSGLVALPLSVSYSTGGGSLASFPCFPSPPSPPIPVSSHSPPASAYPSPGSSGLSSLLLVCQGLATMWAAPFREVNYPSHDGSGLILWRPPPP